MVSKNKQKQKARKRQRSETKTTDDLEVIEVTKQRKVAQDVKVIEVAPKKEEFVVSDESTSILPTREVLVAQLVAALNNKNFAIVEGPLGSGKTFLVSHASKSLSLPMNVMQMGDQIDSKTLFGCYHCTEVAGQFVWKPSKFAEWLKIPCVILLEDVDTANADVISQIVGISASRNFGNSREFFHKDVRIVATISGKGKKNVVLDGVPVKIRLGALTDEELKRLASKAFPRISHLSKSLISIFRSVETAPGTSNSRHLTSTDFLRGCARLEKLQDISSNLKIFAELVDVWCLADPKDRSQELCKKVANALSMTEDQVNFHLSVRQPDISHDDRSVAIGRGNLTKKISFSRGSRHRLGHTRDVVQLMERIAVSVQARESVLLVGETGVGKTSVVQAVADLIGATLSVVNLSPTSDSDELIQGYKPTTIGQILEPFTKFYLEVFGSHFDLKKNSKFIENIEKCLSSGRFRDYLSVVETTANKALNNKSSKKDERWAELLVRARRIRDGLDKGASPFALQKGAVLEAAQKGHWLLVDEINLAPPECLDAIVHAISAPDTHSDFRLFACMNPATDAGKRRLPAGVRTRFSEIFVSETSDPHQLALIVSAYLPSMRSSAVENLVNFYLAAKQQYPASYSLRTLCRALLFTADNLFGSEDRSLYEAVNMAFLTNLDIDEKTTMSAKIAAKFRVATNIPLPTPTNSEDFVKVGGYWIEKGEETPREDVKYVVTKTVNQNLGEIARIVCSGRFPILLEGETSAGKTSIVCHLAKITGHKIVRINNHEHTDVQEYMGSYVADSGGRLVFREGALVRAVREGAWVILDELNLAPTDVIEALNRLLDDNRELFVPEINETIKAHRKFRLFATQNPAGTYSGRKKLSRALLSRFIVLRFHHLPMDELSEMVCTRCDVPPSAAKKMIDVLSELRIKRSLSGLFSARDGLMTLRDVFRWAKRLATDETCDDWLQVLVNHGYFLLAGRCRNAKDEQTVVETLQKIIRRDIDKEKLFAMNSLYMPKDIDTKNIVLTTGMRRMLVFTEQAWLRNEAVLLVGETGGGKTSLAEVVGRGKLRSINCHERTETADLLGRLRPKQDGGFEWSDGVVISAMRDGFPLLVDEISLAEDSVLERLNPLFEEDRTLLLSDAGVETQIVHSSEGFQLVATMNPGGDYGKKELSKALRNRFTEVWTASDYSGDELLSIFDARLTKNEATRDEARVTPTQASKVVVAWIAEFFEKYSHVFRHAPSVRDVVACAELYSSAVAADVSRPFAVRDALSAVFLDSLSGLTTRLAIDADVVLQDALKMLSSHLHKVSIVENAEKFLAEATATTSNALIHQTADYLQIGHLKVEYGKKEPTIPRGFSLKAPTCVENFYRIARGMLINKPILLEGAPGCGKSSTVMALAQLTGNAITRLNLSDQTDLSDLFGSDVPVISDSGNITFRWEDGPVLRAIKNGEWVLLDEMNLASQSVLEGLNACFDHRRILYIAELNRSFEIPSTSNCRFFACQNPRVQGGNRRALPKSFVNRFTNIYTNDLTSGDVEMILEGIDVGRKLSGEERRRMVAVNEECARLAEIGAFVGGPHSFNLRDLLRWFELTASTSDFTVGFEIVYVSRMRREEDRDQLHSVFEKLMMMKAIYPPVQLQLDQNFLRIGKADIVRKPLKSDQNLANSRLLPSQMKVFHELATCVQMNWLALIVGQRNGGKRTIVENLATLSGRTLQTISLNADTDAQELIGSYEQIVDENVVGEAKKQLYQLLEPKISDESTLKKILASGELLDLETATEMALAQCEDQKTVTSCREVLSDASGSAMRFEWIDSVFVRAYLSGHWLLIEDVNLCSAAVLDRLNSCLESGGKLVVAERQNSYEPLSPHPDFRVFLSLDSRAGEISRAMRNRSVEIFMDETSRWHTSVDDVASVVSREELTMSQEIATNVSRLSTEDQLHLAVLLREMPLEIACRYIGVEESMEDEDEEELLRPVCSTTKAVLVREIAALGLAYDTWLANNWRKAAADQIGVEYLLLPFLSSTSSGVANRVLEKVFGRVSESFYTRVLPLLPSPSHRLIDSTFNAGRKSWNKEKETEKFTNNVVFEWALQLAQKIEVLHGSAEHLCRTMTKYEMATSELGFANLPHIAPIIDAILKTLKDGSIKGDRESIFLLALTFLLMTSAARRQLTPRAGCAPLYLVWNDVQKALSSQNIALPSQLAIIAEKLDKGWSSEAHDSFSKDYLVRWRRNALVKPFDNKNQCERYSNQLEEAISAAAAQNSEETEDVHMNEENEEEQKVVIPKSPVDESLRLAASVQALHAFFSAGVVDFSNPVFVKLRPFDGLNWSDPSAARWLQMAAAMSTTLRTSSEDSDVCVLPSSTGGAHSLISHSFFTALSFDPTLQLLAVAHLQNLTMKELRTRLWRFSLNSTPFSDSLGNALLKLQNGLAGWNEPKEAVSCWTERINSGLEMMRKALPPMDTLDPVVFEEERLLFVQKKREIVENQLQLLASYRKLVSRQSPECDSMSSHPIIRRLNQLRQELVAAEKDHNEEVEQNKEAVYRQSANQYSALCAEMRSFFDVALTTSSEASKERTEEDDQMASLAIRTAQLTSFLMSAQSFRQTLLRKYTSFVDVTSPFIAGVMLIECALRESSRKLAGEQRGLELATVAFPKFLKVQPTVDGPLSPEVTAWALRDASPMPLRLKATLVTRRLTDDVTPRDSAVISGEPIFDLQWTRLQWKKWYERNVAKAAEKDFVYRSKTEEEKDELDVVEFFSNENQEKEILPASDVSLMLEAVEDVGKGSLVEESEQKASVLRYRMALAWIRHVIGGVDKMPNDDVTALLNIDSDQTLLELISKREGLCDDGGKEEIIDVYRNSSLRECRRAAEILEKLAVRTREVQERWSEVVALKNVLRAIEEFSATPISTPHIKLAGQIEKLIEECDHWEQMADRANSLQEPLRALQGLLVDWKKMEVRCWSSLLQRTEADAKQRTQLVAFPLFEALYNAETPESLASIVPMAVEWMHNASIVDFSTRVTTVTSLAKWAELLEKAELASRIRSAASHFRQFIPVVEEKLKDERDFAEMNLKDYLKIVKYKDLNLWSIKVSSHKAHIQLFKIIRKFKDAVNPQIDSDFDNLLKMNEWIKLAKPDVNFTSSESSDDVPEDVAEMNKRLKRASKLAGKIAENAASLCDDVSLVELTEQVKSADNSIRTMINYVGEDEEKEKQQGYARNSRQREVAMVLKESQAIGWNARRAVALKAEALNELSVSGVPQGVCENLVRNCSSGRNTTIRKANKVNDQVGISTRKHLTGMIEYGISWQMSLHQKISKYRAEIDKISSSSKALNTAVANFKEEWHIDHESLASDISKVDENLRNISIFVSAMKRRVESIPDNVNDIDASCSDHLHPLSKLGSNDETAKKVRQLVGHLVNLSDTMTLTNGNCGDRKIYEKKDVTIWTNQHLSDSKEMRSVASELAPWFAVETAQILEILNSLETIVTKQRNIEPQIKTVEPTSLLMIVQSLYKDLVELRKDEKPKTEDEKKLDVINVVAMSLENCDIRRVITWLESLVEELRIGICLETSSLAVLASLVDVVRKLLTQCNALLADTLAQFCQLYHAVLSLTVQLFEKGYVNTIPKAEKQESGEGQTDEAGEGGGMGEGSTANDAKDVTDEMEETGQLEGLQDEPPADVDNDRADNTNEKPIEMEDDFAEDLQDIDKNDKGGPDDEEGDDEEEPEPEDQMGDVEEEDEKQLDPKLWDDEDEEEQQQDQQKNMDQENTAADQKTDDMVAKEDEPQPQEDGEQKPEDVQEDQENVDERDREDDDGGDVDDKNQQPEVDEEARREDEIGPDDDETKGDDSNMDEMMEDDGDETDKEDDENEETKDGEGDEENEESADVEMDEPPTSAEEDKAKNEESEEKMEQGTGGERNDEQKNDQETGGANEDDEEEEDEQKKEEQGEGKSKNDPRGESGAGEDAKEKEDKEDEEEDEMAEENREKAERRELADENRDLEEEAEQGEGEENESGKHVENAPAAERQMLGAGSLDEAKQTKREEQQERKAEKKRKLPQGLMDQLGAEESGEVEDDEAEDVQQASIHLAAPDMFALAEEVTRELVIGNVAQEEEPENPSGEKNQIPTENENAESQWAAMSRTVSMLSAELAENLRLILEPQRASKMQGDYRSGKRLNMRRLIPYIASEYRKDRIWMRRTKRAQREYQILIAVDDSASMNENGIHQVTCESVCVVEDALRRCDAGSVSVCSFGSEIRTIVPFGESSATSSVEMLKKLSFGQKSTDLLLMLKTARRQLDEIRTPTSEQMLIVVSDGRGALAQGADKVKAHYAALQGVTVLFVILDSGDKSIHDLKVASFKDGGVVLTPYLSLFPFPFYAIVNTIQQLPSVIAESIRQWFEMTAQTA